MHVELKINTVLAQKIKTHEADIRSGKKTAKIIQKFAIKTMILLANIKKSLM